MRLTKEIAKQIIDLNPDGTIDKAITDRQFEVILKGFNHLIGKENRFLYVADEVGLGKTYIALGIASLLRYYSNNVQSHSDAIIVPKANLQVKWQKEINNFIRYNFLKSSNRVKTILNTPVGENTDLNVHHKFRVVNKDYPSYEIFRNSSFSIGKSTDSWEHDLRNGLSESSQILWDRAVRKDLTEEKLRRLYAYLLNLDSHVFDTLIVDEAHNFKHGTKGEVSYRNQVMSRFMGNWFEEDQDLLDCVPELKDVKSIARKVIMLSATPMDNGAYEIANQLDVFIPEHKYKSELDEERSSMIIQDLSRFMIRGVMKLVLGGTTTSRNQYRHEHRKGNIDKEEFASPQKIDNPFDAAIIGSIQYHTMNQLNKNKGKSFEIGMLAGFESFLLNKSDKEGPVYEKTNTKSEQHSEDTEVIMRISDSYYKKFREYLPHPKQDKLIDKVYKEMLNGRKSLIFVRRIASVNEIERKLNKKFEDYQLNKVNAYLRKNNSNAGQLLKAYSIKDERFRIEKVYDLLVDRIIQNHLSDEQLGLKEVKKEERPKYLKNKLKALLAEHESEVVQDLIYKNLGKSVIKAELRLEAVKFIKEKSDLEIEENESQDKEADESSRYFFSDFFSNSYFADGTRFKKRLLTRDWLRFNYYYLFEKLNVGVRIESLSNSPVFKEGHKTEVQRMDYMNDSLIASFDETVSNLNHVHSSYQNKTFMTKLLLETFASEFRDWLDYQVKHHKLDEVIERLDALVEIIASVFRNGSGTLPLFLGEKEVDMFEVLETSFPEVLSEIKVIIKDFESLLKSNFSDFSKIRTALFNQVPVIAASGQHKRSLSRTALQFRMPGFPYVLISTDVLKEGEDLHTYCSDIYHYGVAWNPSDMEQRTGRIDRINSQSYKRLKSSQGITFDNSLQVYYPYLADTLEVNQVTKVFKKMNEFIETFYDVTKKVEKDSKSRIDDTITEIPEQIKSPLDSKYDYEHFTSINNSSQELEVQESIGLSLLRSQEKMNYLFDELNNVFTFKSIPRKSSNQLKVHGIVEINDRNGPFQVELDRGRDIGQYFLNLDSIICKSTEMRSRRLREQIDHDLRSNNMHLVDEKGFLMARKKVEFSDELSSILSNLKQVIIKADKIEEDVFGITTDGDDGF